MRDQRQRGLGLDQAEVAVASRHEEQYREWARGVLHVAQRWHELRAPSARRERLARGGNAGAVEEALMAIVAGLDVHRAQITFDALDTDSGEVTRGRIDATPAAVARWTERFGGAEIDVAVEACTGWLFVCDALLAAGAVAHLAEPVETRALRGRKRRAKTDREDARWLRELLAEGRLPEAWIPPEHVRQWRSRARMRHTLIDERTQWMQLSRRPSITTASAARPRSCALARGARSWTRSRCRPMRVNGSRSRFRWST